MDTVQKNWKFTVNVDNFQSDFDTIRKLKAEEESRIEKDPAKRKDNSNIVEVNIENNNVVETNIEFIGVKKVKRRRERQAVTALRNALLQKLVNKQEIFIKLGEVAADIEFDVASLHSAKKELKERGEFIFTRSFGGPHGDKGLIVRLGNKGNS